MEGHGAASLRWCRKKPLRRLDAHRGKISRRSWSFINAGLTQVFHSVRVVLHKEWLPCLNESLALEALHHAGNPEWHSPPCRLISPQGAAIETCTQQTRLA
jgi:hypothetical protein